MTDQTDRELLELAARAFIAAGYKSRQFSSPDDAASFLCEGGKVWHPLTDDGDALRLAVKLNLAVGCFDNLGHACASTVDLCRDVYFSDEPDPYAATRRAIVRAAAAIAQNGATK